tara:strand:+ start:2668 stop:2838 length:171 start_codon:yes stop_codon:yes gene_type:complete
MQKFKIKSKSDPDKEYTVEYNGEDFACECKGFNYTGHCWHIESIQENEIVFGVKDV